MAAAKAPMNGPDEGDQEMDRREPHPLSTGHVCWNVIKEGRKATKYRWYRRNILVLYRVIDVGLFCCFENCANIQPPNTIKGGHN